ncbi:MAG: GNAT family N-acetyltransferase, partial [Balneolaceae bacterium]|nr:GNAT family N-acetyltransferase [Balneolaceae bacterium]
MIQSERIYLRLFDEKDVPLRVKWMNDPEIREMLNAPYPVSEQSTKRWLASVLEDSTRIDFAICIKETDR